MKSLHFRKYLWSIPCAQALSKIWELEYRSLLYILLSCSCILLEFWLWPSPHLWAAYIIQLVLRLFHCICQLSIIALVQLYARMLLSRQPGQETTTQLVVALLHMNHGTCWWQAHRFLVHFQVHCTCGVFIFIFICMPSFVQAQVQGSQASIWLDLGSACDSCHKGAGMDQYTKYT